MDLTLTEDSYRALARSSPWRWTSVHLVRGDVEAWVRRPGLMLVDVQGERHVVRDVVRDGARTVGYVMRSGGRTEEQRLPLASTTRPVTREDGLVTLRPDAMAVSYDDPMWQSYDWVAMLDPVELADGAPWRAGADGEIPPGVALADPRESERHGRRTWWATATPLETYEPRCGCCPLLQCEVAERHEAAAGGPAPEDRRALATTFEVALDVQTGICVAVHPVDGSGSRGHSLRLLAVDEEYPDAMFVSGRG